MSFFGKKFIKIFPVFMLATHTWSSLLYGYDGEHPNNLMGISAWVQSLREAEKVIALPARSEGEHKKVFLARVLREKLLLDAKIVSDKARLLKPSGDTASISVKLQIAQSYGIANLHDKNEIKSRVAPVPTLMVLGQFVLESGWGCSVYAKKHNNFVGFYTFSNAGKDRKIKRFASLSECLGNYMRVLNSKEEYRFFRRMRTHGADAGSIIASNGLDSYCETPGYANELIFTIGTVKKVAGELLAGL